MSIFKRTKYGSDIPMPSEPVVPELKKKGQIKPPKTKPVMPETIPPKKEKSASTHLFRKAELWYDTEDDNQLYMKTEDEKFIPIYVSVDNNNCYNVIAHEKKKPLPKSWR